MDFPEDLYYTKDHEWIKYIKSQETCVIGITEYAQEKLGEIVHVELPDEEDEVRAEEPFGSVESVKAVSDIFSPISGKVVDVNSVLLDSPEILNEDPYEDGWIIKVKVTDSSILEELMSASEYKEFIESSDVHEDDDDDDDDDY